MKYDYPHLCSPITIAGKTFPHRMFSAPMGGTDITNDGCIGPKSAAFYELRAKGGAAAVTVSECMVHPVTDGSHAYHLDTAVLNSLASATYAADAISRHGAVPSLELSHSGMYAGTYMTDKTRQHEMCQWGPSDTTRPDGVPVRALSKEQIDEIVQAYGTVAGLAKRAGFEMIMIHGGHGWLINQFLSPYFNHRTDEYGGSWKTAAALPVRYSMPSAPLSARCSRSSSVSAVPSCSRAAMIWKKVSASHRHWSPASICFTFPPERIREASAIRIRRCSKTTDATFTSQPRSKNTFPFRSQRSAV